MKKPVILFLIFGIFIQTAAAQKPSKSEQRKFDIDDVIANKGALLSLEADKTLLDANESARLSIKILVYPQPVEGDETPPLVLPDEINLPTDDSSPYKATNWKILQGGGTLIGIDANTQNYTAPTKEPIDKTMTISVDLIPQRPKFPKVVLIQTLYFSENETAFTLHIPTLGIFFNKYVSKNDGGAKLPVIDPRVAKNLPPDVRQKLEEAQKKSEQQNIDLNTTALTSNATALYDPVQGFTAVRFSGLGIERLNGKPEKSPTLKAVLAFNFNGKGIGTYNLGEDKTGLGFYLPMQQKAFGCGDTESQTEKYPCDGKVTITSLDDKFIKGTVRATVFTSVDKKIYRGVVYGKFTANRAN